MTEFVIYDALCGSGKTTKVKQYFIDNCEKEKFIYITPFISECHNMAGTTPDEDNEMMPKICDFKNSIIYDENNPISKLRFKHPDRKKGRGSKENSLAYLMKNGHNIVSTHQLFRHMSIDSLDGAENMTLVIDEALSVYEENTDIKKSEVKKLLNIGILYLDEDKITLRFDRSKFGDNSDCEIDKVAETAYESLAMMCDLSQLMLIDGQTLVWEMSADMLKKFKKVIICTYMFEGQLFDSYLKKHNISYTIEKFGKQPRDVKHLFNVLNDKYLNSIGVDDTALSKSFFEKPSTKKKVRDDCRKHLHSVMTKWKAKTDNRLFTCFKADKSIIANTRYNKNWLPFNCRATNEYGHITNVAYLVNIYPSPILVKASNSKETEFSVDVHALQEMIQFLYRSALRNDKAVNIYIPSSRMRGLLFRWLDGEFSK